MNLTELLKNQVTNAIAGKAASYFDAPESGVTSALNGILPSLLGKVISMSESKSGLDTVMDMVNGADNSLLDNVGDLFGSAKKMDGLMKGGSGILSTLLGNNLGSMVDAISKMSGLKGGTSSSLIKLAAPFLMSTLGRVVKEKALDAVGLGKLFSSQKKSVFGSIPGVLGSVLNFGSDMLGAAKDAGNAAVSTGSKVAAGATKAAGEAVETGVNTGKSILRWLLPLFLILLLASYFGFRTGCSAVDNTVDATKDGVGAVSEGVGNAADAVAEGTKDVVSGAADMAGDAANAVAAGVSSAFSKVNDAAKAALDKITFTAGSVGDQMVNYINGGFKGNPNFRFKNLTFATGSAEIDAASELEVDNLAAILKAYPGVNISIDGYTDNTGDAANNVKLSQARAESVKQRLQVKGIGAGRINAKGHGSANPVATNGTEEGRAQNRRIEVTVVQ